MIHHRWAGAGLAALASFVIHDAAQASGYFLREQSAVGQGASFAGVTARGDDPSMIFFNPAAMAWLPGNQLAIVGSGIFPQAEADRMTGRRATLLGGSVISGGPGGDAISDAFVPATYATVALGDQWHIGLGITSPFGLITKYGPDFVGRYHAQTTSLRTINITPAVSWRPTETFSIGAGLQIQYADARLSSAVDFGGVLAGRGAAVLPGSRDGRSTLTGDDTAIGWQIGAQWRPLPGTMLGLSFRSAIFHELEGDAKFEGVPAPLATTFRDTGGRARLTTPESLAFGVTQAIGDRFTLLAGAEWTNWSRFRTLTVQFENGLPNNVTEERWRDTVFLSIGGEYRATDTVTLRAGFAWDQTPVRDTTRTPRIPDSNRYWLSAGLSWAVTPSITVSAAYTHIFGSAADVDLAAGGPTSPDFLRGSLNGSYSASVDILSAQLRFSF
ncbi:OmpP1/FadL family transporter [Plastoroseomonas hellenica]|uniref:Transporter n=1 Tax=Plastoroseomonas hellenica TaxID=2687306 RepID=A0ABS5EXL9_9PROT|nr:TonB-dependent receptor [Plastoroseomonas hellenica]MBR0643207.1 transporter [Plastoroseomonas hellenica]MBR0665023.1 transporter [Plastoroseomonas hellenica]